MKKVIILLCIVWMGFIFYMSSNNGETSHAKSNKIVNFIESKLIQEDTIKAQKVREKQLTYIVRKSAHAFIYIVLAIFVSAILFAFNKKGKHSIIYILFICLIYAVIDEYHQSFIANRTSSVGDVLIDFGGVLIGVIFFYLAYYLVYERYRRYAINKALKVPKYKHFHYNKI
ncbi:VanZ family protein [Clostridium vincentii]|nr:VanZ family protein [Clostridium vincentii]